MSLKKNTEEKWLVIVNPNAGSRKCEKDWPKIEKLLNKSGFSYETLITSKRYDAVRFAKENIPLGYHKILVIGGDGTLNEVVNGIFLQKDIPTTDVLLAMIPVGTGNDWGKMYQIPSKYSEAIEIIKEQKTFIQDVGKVTFYQDKLKKTRYFLNVAGMGYDAAVAAVTNKQKDLGKGGPMSYFINIFKVLFSYKIANSEITVDGEKVPSSLFSMNVGICKYNGGGFMQLPYAISDDGLLDVTVIGKVGKFFVIRNVHRLSDGSFVKLPQIKTMQGKHIRVDSNPQGSIFLETDGESLGHTPMDFTIEPLSLKVVINEVVKTKV